MAPWQDIFWVGIQMGKTMELTALMGTIRKIHENPHLDCETHPCFMGISVYFIGGSSTINIHKSLIFHGKTHTFFMINIHKSLINIPRA